jgi:hypothetical protein
MGLFSKKPNREQTFRFRSHPSFVRELLVFLFWVWGVLGLLFNGSSVMGLTGSAGGGAAYLTATSLIWIGGMLLFGIGALLSHLDYDGVRPRDSVEDIRIQ